MINTSALLSVPNLHKFSFSHKLELMGLDKASFKIEDIANSTRGKFAKINNGYSIYDQTDYILHTINVISIMKHGVLHNNNDNPSVLRYDNIDGNVVYISYHRNGAIHRINKPAIIEYIYEINKFLPPFKIKGKFCLQKIWSINNKIHNICGSASVRYFLFGKRENFYINGFQHTLNSFCSELQRREKLINN